MLLTRYYSRIAGGFIGTLVSTWHAYDNELLPNEPALSTMMMYSGTMCGMLWEVSIPLYTVYWGIRYINHRRCYGNLSFIKHTFSHRHH